MTPVTPRPTGADRTFLWLLRAYPADFRRKFAEGMRASLLEDREAARRRGRGALAAFWLRAAFDLVTFGLAERWRAARWARWRQGSSISSGSGRSPMRSRLSFDCRDAWRSLRATPLVTAIAVASLAFGIGANTALFSILDSLIYKSLPVREPDRLVTLGADGGSWTNPIWEQIRSYDNLFAGAFAWAEWQFDIAKSGEARKIDGAYASGGALDVLGVPAVLGRTLSPEDDRRGGGKDGPVAMISYRFWQREFGGAPDAIGSTITVQHVPCTIVGVTPPGFSGPEVGVAADLILPIGVESLLDGSERMLNGRSNWWLSIWARLKPGQSVAEATSALRGVQPKIREATLPQDWQPSEQATYLTEPDALVFSPAATGTSYLRARYTRPLTVMLVVVGLVLLIACANIANLLIARATARRHELSLRLALGASRWRVARQLVIESAMLAGAGAAAGLLFAVGASRLLVAQLSTANRAVDLDLALDWRVLAFTLGVSVLTALLFGIAPAIGVARLAPNDALKERSRGTIGDGRMGVRQLLVVAQVAMSLALVVGAALFARSFYALTTRALGVDADPILTVAVDITRSRVPREGRGDLYDRIERAFSRVPGVARVASSDLTPVGGSSWNTLVALAGHPLERPKDLGGKRQPLPWVNAVTPGWFETYGIRLIAGRDFDARDRAGSQSVIIVNQAFANRYFPGENPIGRHVTEGVPQDSGDREIVGLVADSVYRSIREDLPATIYKPEAQLDGPGVNRVYSVRAAGGTADAAARLSHALGAAVADIDPDASYTFRGLGDQFSASLTQDRVVAALAGFFGLLALLLAGLGLYGVTAYSVARRRTEIGIRMALGARPGGIVGMVLGRVAWTVGVGVVAGALLSWWASTYVATLLYDVEPRDPGTFGVAAVTLAGIAALAAWLPARHAAGVDPTVALRE